MEDANTQAIAADLEKRVKGFNEKFIPLLKEFQLALGASAFITNDGRIGARPQLFDDKKEEKPAEPAPAAAPAAPAPAPADAASDIVKPE